MQLTINLKDGKNAFSGIPTRVHHRLPGLNSRSLPLLQNDDGLLSGLQSNALATLIHFVYTSNACTAFEAERRPPSFCSTV